MVWRGRPLDPGLADAEVEVGSLGTWMQRLAVIIGIIVASTTCVVARADDVPSPAVAAPNPPASVVPAPAAPTPAAKAPGAKAATQPPPKSAVLSVAPDVAEAILGQRVIGPKGREIGRLVDVLVDASGQPEAAVIDFGGFMGVGNRKVAVHWSVLRFSPADPKHKVTLEMTPDQIKAAPEFLNPNKPAPVVTPTNIAPAAH